MAFDLKYARFPRDRGIAICLSPGAEPFANVASHTAMNLLTDIVEEKRAHQAAYPDLNLVLHAFVRGYDVDLIEAQLFRDMMQISRVTADAIDTFDNDGVKSLTTGCIKKPGQGRGDR